MEKIQPTSTSTSTNTVVGSGFKIAKHMNRMNQRQHHEGGNSNNSNVNVIGETVRMKGDLKFDQYMRIDGVIEGKLHGSPEGELIVSQTGIVKGDILNIKSIQIEGKVVGNLSAESITLQGFAAVYGDVSCRFINIDPTVILIGSLTVSIDYPNHQQIVRDDSHPSDANAIRDKENITTESTPEETTEEIIVAQIEPINVDDDNVNAEKIDETMSEERPVENKESFENNNITFEIEVTTVTNEPATETNQFVEDVESPKKPMDMSAMNESNVLGNALDQEIHMEESDHFVEQPSPPKQQQQTFPDQMETNQLVSEATNDAPSVEIPLETKEPLNNDKDNDATMNATEEITNPPQSGSDEIQQKEEVTLEEHNTDDKEIINEVIAAKTEEDSAITDDNNTQSSEDVDTKMETKEETVDIIPKQEEVIVNSEDVHQSDIQIGKEEEEAEKDNTTEKQEVIVENNDKIEIRAEQPIDTEINSFISAADDMKE